MIPSDSERSLEGHTGPVQSCCFSPDGKHVLSASGDWTLKLWCATSGMLRRTFEGHTASVFSCCFSPDGELALSASEDKTLMIWRVTDGSQLQSLAGHLAVVSSCCFSPDGKLVLSSSSDKTLKIWRTADGVLERTLRGHVNTVVACCFSPDCSMILSGSGDRTLRVWRTSDGSLSRKLVGHISVVMSCCFSPDSSLVLSASSDSNLKLWCMSEGSGSVLRTLTGHAGWVVSCCFSPDGELVLSASCDKTLKLWRTSTGVLLHTLVGHGGSVVCCCFSPDGSRVLSASSDTLKLGLVMLSNSRDKTLKLWRVADGSLERSLEGHTANVHCCCFSPDGSVVLSASADKTLRFWRLSASGSPRASHILEPWIWSMSDCAGTGGVDCDSAELLERVEGLVEELTEERRVRALLEQRLQACEAELAAERLLREDERNDARRAYAWLLAGQLPPPSHYTEYSVDPLPLDGPLGELYAHLMVSTAARHREAQKSQTFCPAPVFEVLGVRSVVNPRLVQKYLAKLDDLEGKHCSGCTTIPVLSHLRHSNGCTDSRLNEHLLFHGAPPSAIDKICKGGFNPQRGGESSGNMFGTAAYFAANSSKCDIYTEERTSMLPRTAVRTIIIARVALGESYRAGRPLWGISRPPDSEDGSDEYDSVWADVLSNGGCVDHLETMVYSESQALPVALVDYRHVETCQCAECHKRQA